MKCPHCHEEIPEEALRAELARRGGLSTSEAKAEAARKNGAKGGRPPMLELKLKQRKEE